MREIYVIPRLEELDKFEKLKKEYNLHYEYNDFFIPDTLDNKETLNSIIKHYTINQNDTLHGAFLDTCLDSMDKKIRAISFERFKESIEVAIKLNCKAVIFHTNFLNGVKTERYRNNWLKCNKEAYKLLLKMYPNISIYVENMFDDYSDMLASLASEMSDEPRFGVCLDIAHAYLSKQPIEDWIKTLKPYIRHIHMNDNMRDADSHLAIGDGNIPYDIVFENIKDIDATILLEVKNYKDTDKSLQNIRRWLDVNIK